RGEVMMHVDPERFFHTLCGGLARAKDGAGSECRQSGEKIAPATAGCRVNMLRLRGRAWDRHGRNLRNQPRSTIAAFSENFNKVKGKVITKRGSFRSLRRLAAFRFTKSKPLVAIICAQA